MENSQSSTQGSQAHGRKDSVMAIPSIEDRLRRLEEAHSIHGPADVNSPLVCNASLKHTQQISELGSGYNSLDEALHALEQANNNREERLRKLEQQIIEPQSIELDRQNMPRTDEGATVLIGAKPDPAVSALLVDLKAQKSILHNLATRLCELEKRSTYSLSTFTTHDIAQTLVQRLGNGDELEALVHLQLRTTLGARDGTPMTPAPTSTTRGESTMSIATFVEQQTKASPFRPPKRKMDDSASDEPVPKRQRSRPSNSISSDSLSVKSEPKRGRGRPPTHGRYARKSSSTASSSSSAPPPATIPAPRSVPGRTLPKKKGTATKLTKTMLKTRIANDQPPPEVGKHWRNRIISGSTNSDVSMEQTEIITPKRTIRLMGDATAASGDAKSDEPIAVATKEQRGSTSKISQLKPSCHHSSNSRTNATPQTNMFTPNRKSSTPLSSESTPMSQSRARKVNGDSPSRRKGHSSPGYRDVDAPDLGAMEDSSAGGLEIPPERRSSRKPKAAKHFGDMVSWKEANKQVGGLRPSSSSSYSTTPSRQTIAKEFGSRFGL